MPLAHLLGRRRVSVATRDGASFIGLLEGIVWVQSPGRLTPVLEVVDASDGPVLLERDDIARIDGHPQCGSRHEIAALVAESIEGCHLDEGDERHWDVPLGAHECLEVTVRRVRRPCQPVGPPY